MSFVGSLRRVKIRENTRSLKSFIMSNDSRANLDMAADSFSDVEIWGMLQLV